ncbi:MAG: AMP-binding protein, partial [Psychrosphaera sp.]|nr:AMP-binding protein [Psychrosphaera sp.]
MTPLKLHPAQENVYFEQTLNPDSPMYNIGWFTQLDRVYDTDILNTCWSLLYQHLDALRLVIEPGENATGMQTIQAVDSGLDILEVVDFSGGSLPQKEVRQRVDIWMEQQLDSPMDYLGGQTCRLVLLKLSATHSIIYTQFHHIVIDGAGLHQIHGLLARVYACVEQGQSTDWLQQVPSYFEAVNRALDYLDSADYLRDKNYWAGFVSKGQVLRIPARHLSKEGDCQDGAQYKIALGDALSAQMRHFCQQQQLSPLAVLTAVVSLYFARTSGQSNQMLATVVHGRQNETEMQLPGMFSNMIPIACEVGPDSRFEQLCQQVKLNLRQNRAHRRFPASHISRLSRNDQNAQPDIQVLYDVFCDKTTFKIGGAPNHLMTRASNVQPLVIRLVDCDDHSFKLRVTYAQCCFNSEEINALMLRLVYLFEQAMEMPDHKVNRFSLILPSERKALESINQTQASYPNQTLHQLFETQVHRTPDNRALAMSQPDGTLTYLSYVELNQKAEQLAALIRANYLRQYQRQMNKDTVIALYLDRSFEMVISILAVLKAGGAYVPVSLEIPSARARFIISDTQSPMVLTQQRHMALLADCIAPLQDKPELIGADNLPRNDTLIEPFAPVTGDDLAYVIYTSGTTGKPKGVMVTHKAAVNRIHWMQREYPLNSRDRVLQKPPYSFDVSVWELLWANQVGATIVMAGPDTHKQPQAINELISRAHITVTHFVPSMLGAYNQYLKQNQYRLPSSVKQGFCSGEAVTAVQVKDFRALSDQKTALINLYGPTEAAIDVSHFDTALMQDNKVAIGRPIQNIRLLVLNAQQ